MARVLVTETIADGGLERLRQAGHTVDVSTGLSPEELLTAVKGAHALIIRSATTVTAEVLEAATDLVVVGRAGIGLDNVDVEAATRRGVMVVERAPVEHPLDRRAHDRDAARRRPERAAGPPGAHRRPVGALEVGGRRAGRQDPRHRRARAHRQARRAAGRRVRDADRRPRPLRGAGAGPAAQHRPAGAGRAGRGVRLRHPARREDPRDRRDDRRRLPGQGQGRPAHRERVARRGDRRGRAGRRHPRRPASAAPRSTCSRASRRPSRRCSTGPRWSSPRTSGPAPARRRTRRATRSPSRWGWPWPASSCRSR